MGPATPSKLDFQIPISGDAPEEEVAPVMPQSNLAANLQLARMMRMKDHVLLGHYSDKNRKKKKRVRKIAQASRRKNR